MKNPWWTPILTLTILFLLSMSIFAMIAVHNIHKDIKEINIALETQKILNKDVIINAKKIEDLKQYSNSSDKAVLNALFHYQYSLRKTILINKRKILKLKRRIIKYKKEMDRLPEELGGYL
jgi:hypothetical protein